MLLEWQYSAYSNYVLLRFAAVFIQDVKIVLSFLYKFYYLPSQCHHIIYYYKILLHCIFLFPDEKKVASVVLSKAHFEAFVRYVLVQQCRVEVYSLKTKGGNEWVLSCKVRPIGCMNISVLNSFCM